MGQDNNITKQEYASQSSEEMTYEQFKEFKKTGKKIIKTKSNAKKSLQLSME